MSFGSSPVLIDGVSFIAASTGTGDFVYSVARPSFWTPAQAVTASTLTDGQTVAYLAQDDPYAPTQREWGLGTYVNSTLTVQRTTVKGGISGGISSGTSKVNFTKAPVVSLTALAENIVGYDSSGNALINESALHWAGPLEVSKTSSCNISALAWNSGGNPAQIWLGYSRGTAIGTQAAVNSGDVLGSMFGLGSDGTGFKEAAEIDFIADGTPATSTVPGRIVFSTTPAGSSQAPIERMRIDSAGLVSVGGVPTIDAFSVTPTTDVPTGTSYFAIGGYNTGSGGTNSSVTLGIANYNNDGFGDGIYNTYAHGTKGSPSIVASGDTVGQLTWQAHNGTTLENVAQIQAQMDVGTPSATSMPGLMLFFTTPAGSINMVERARIDNVGHLFSSTVGTSTGGGGFGYGPSGIGVGGTVTQLTSKSTAVTLNTLCGQITTNSASLTGNAAVAFTVNNTSVLSTDVILCTISSGRSATNYTVGVDNIVSGTSFEIVIRNLTPTAEGVALVINYAIIRATTS